MNNLESNYKKGSEKLNLVSKMESLDMSELVKIFKEAMNLSESRFSEIFPLDEDEWSGFSKSSEKELEEYKNIGLKSISDGKVAVALLGGGQGTRLGVEYPKGMYDVGLPSHKSLFQIHAERILRLERMAFMEFGGHVSMLWLIMTSEFTNEQTRTFFEENNYFGLKKTQVHIFEQGMLPAFDLEGKLFEKGMLCPNGNGDLFSSLQSSGMLKLMTHQGVEYLHVFSVDNILVKVGDPIFLGYFISKQAECGIKVIERLQPDEPLGSVCKLIDGSYGVLEYSEIKQNVRNLRAHDGSLLFKAGNICIHLFTLTFLHRLVRDSACQLPYHIAKKKIPYVDSHGVVVYPEEPNGIKLEKFIFDCVPFTQKLAVWEVKRDEEFSPLKNSNSLPVDNPTTSRNAFLQLSKKYFMQQNPQVSQLAVIEVSPLVSYWDEGLTGLGDVDSSAQVLYITDDEGRVVVRDLSQ